MLPLLSLWTLVSRASSVGSDPESELSESHLRGVWAVAGEARGRVREAEGGQSSGGGTGCGSWHACLSRAGTAGRVSTASAHQDGSMKGSAGEDGLSRRGA